MMKASVNGIQRKKHTVDLFDIINSWFEQDHTKLQDGLLDWFSKLGVKLRTHQEQAGNFTTCTISNICTNFLVITLQNICKIKVNLRPIRF